GMITRGDIAKAFFNSYRTISHEYDTIINSTHNMIISVDENGMIKVCNLSMARFLGVNGMDMIGKNILEVLPNSNLVNVVKTGKEEPLKQIELNGHFLISNRSPIVKDGKIIGAVAVLQDISDLDKMSQELNYVKELNKELDAIVESSYDGLFITDGNGITLRYNKAFEQLTLIDTNEYRGKSVEEIKRNGIISDPVTLHVLEQKKSITVMQESQSGKL
ncbi:MAG TPA: AAA family ATPase, partial [Syntrophomonas sp.]|nr:AAA family ATPase [Syntrophomonas sp.]